MLWLKLIGGVVSQIVLFGVMLFAPAPTWNWPRAWIFLGVVAICTSATMFGVMAHNEALLDERYKSPMQSGQPLADKIIIVLLILSFIAFVAFLPHDVFQSRLLGTTGPLVATLGLVLFVAGWTIISLAFRENAFAAPVIKHQEERHQAVIDSGVYRIVRHPMYAGAIPMMVGMALWLGSYAGALFALIPLSTVAVRILFEERFLKRELPGYEQYTHRVRYRMIPFVW
jgi:protein-S-isoprenylcysteine O-methyltransferase Ste14